MSKKLLLISTGASLKAWAKRSAGEALMHGYLEELEAGSSGEGAEAGTSFQGWSEGTARRLADALVEGASTTAELDTVRAVEESRCRRRLGAGDHVVFLASDTPLGRACAVVLAQALRFARPGVETRVAHLSGLDVSKNTVELTKALGAMLVTIERCLSDERVRHIPRAGRHLVMSGGFKVMAAIVAVAGSLLGVEVVFAPQGRREPVAMPPLKLVPDLEAWRPHYRALDSLVERPRSCMPWDQFQALAFGAPPPHHVPRPLLGLVERVDDEARLTAIGRLLVEAAHAQYRDAHLGLAWRRNFVEDCLVPRLLREDRIAVALLDLDHFKRVNDCHGHEIGDLVLKGFVEHAVEVIRRWEQEEDGRLGELVRWGGEEFVLIINRGPEIELLAEAVRRRIESELGVQGGVVRVTTSIGGSWVRLPDDMQLGDLTYWINRLRHRADRCLYEAKERGRNRVICQSYE